MSAMTFARWCALAPVLFAVWTSECADLVRWHGAALADWTNVTAQCRNVRRTGDGIGGEATGTDSQLTTALRTPFVPRANQTVVLRARTSEGGRGQLFWLREGDADASESRQRPFYFARDNEWHEYRIRPAWRGEKPIVGLRLDFPQELRGGTWEVADIRVEAVGEELNLDTREKTGVRFDLTMPAGVHYCSLVWDGSKGPGKFGFSPAVDGKRHTYYFDLKGKWKGTVWSFEVAQVRKERVLDVENLEFVAKRPALGADPVVLSARPAEAIPRAGRPLPVEVVVRNFGTEALKDACFVLPDGSRQAVGLGGGDGRDSIDNDMADEPAGERAFRIVFPDPGAGDFAADLLLRGANFAERRFSVSAKVLPSLGLPRADYPPQPRPVGTAPYEIGAFLFPGWTDHRWHAVRSHAPWRKPVLGWYDETKPETIDWQIKHLVENGVSYVFVDWYWNAGHMYLNHWMKAFARAKYRRHLKWSLMWCNHNPPGTHSAEDQRRVTEYWIKNYFADPQYQKIDGKPVVSVWSSGAMEHDWKAKGGCRALLDISREMAKAAGYPDIHFVAVRGDDSERPEVLKLYEDRGFDATCVYKYMGVIPGVTCGVDFSRPYKWLADSSYGHWKRLEKNTSLPFLPSLTTGWDDRPWRGENGYEIYGMNARDFRRICADAKRYSDESGRRMLLMGPLDEWGEGSIGYPNAEHGFGLLEAVRETFGRRDAQGTFPLNYAPEDVGLTCPQRPEPAAADETVSSLASGGANTVSGVGQVTSQGNVRYEGQGRTGGLLCVGSSFAWHAPNPKSLKWFGDWGMAASAREKDAVHRVWAAVRRVNPGAPLCIAQSADWERHYDGDEEFLARNYPQVRGFKPDWILIITTVGNAPKSLVDREPLGAHYEKMVEWFRQTNPNAKVVLSTGSNPEFARTIREYGAKRGFPVVDFAEFLEKPGMRATGLFEHPGVAWHPSDAGFAEMARRYVSAFGLRMSAE